MDMSSAAQPSDSDMSDAVHPLTADQQPPPQQQLQQQVCIPATLSHGGRFIQHNIFGNVFEVTSKYKPPIMPIGKGAYGIVCLALNSDTNEHVAIKKIANAFDNKLDAKRTLREIKLLRHIDHENSAPHARKTECGYYVMRYMIEIITRSDLKRTVNEHFNDMMPYSQEDIDEVRGLWADYFLNN